MSNILMMYLPSFLINMNGLKCLSCAFIPYPKHLYSAGATDGSGYSLVFPFFSIYDDKGNICPFGSCLSLAYHALKDNKCSFYPFLQL